jgi:hypothetical protein
LLPQCFHEDLQFCIVSLIPFNIIASASKEKLKKKEKELEWLSGFSEAESLFFIHKTSGLSFKIKLHWDDKQTLVFIQNLLSELSGRSVGIITDSKDQHESYFAVNRFIDIQELIIPIFSIYFFTTTKYLDFQDFKAAAGIKRGALLEKRKLTEIELKIILTLKSGMNSNRKIFDISSLPKRQLTPYRILGFVEGDGTFCLPNLIPTFGIKQHSKNIHFLYEIAEYLNNLPYGPEIGPKLDKLNTKPTATVYTDTKTRITSLSVANILQIYNYILPFFKALDFKSRKIIDFQYWEIAVKLKALGYTTKVEGKLCLIEISQYINKRYTTNPDVKKVPVLSTINNVFNVLANPPVFDLALGLSFKTYSDLVKINKRGNEGYAVNVYENGKLLKGSPFFSYTQAAIAMGNINISSAISKKIDTGKLYKQRFKFESSILSDNCQQD